MIAGWIPVALSRDLPPRVVVPAVTQGEELALWRSEAGRVHAWRDRCPHRGMRLSHGFVRGEMLSCIYHGWRYDGDGRCRKIPAHPDLVPPASIAVGTFPCSETRGVIFVSVADVVDAPAVPDGLMPLRSVDVRAGLDRIVAAGATPGDGGVLRWAGDDVELTLLPQAVPGGTVLHALVPGRTAPAGQIAASRAIEALRHAAEREVTA